MEVIKIQLDTVTTTDIAIALGNFDGVHVGHMALIEEVIKMSKRLDVKSSVLVFSEHSRNLINSNRQCLINSNEVKYKIFENLGIDIIYEIEFTSDFMKLSPDDFVLEFLQKNLKVRGIVVGFDYRFGHKASGNTDILNKLTGENNIELKVIDPVTEDGIKISSSLIRELIENGEIAKANRLMTRPFTITGEIVHGKKLGSKMNYPTANIKMDSNFIIPKYGVYDTNIIVDGKKYKAASSVGTNPSVNGEGLSIEAHILDFNKTIYGYKVYLEFLDFLRPELKFNSVEELFEQIKADTNKVRER